MLKELLVICAVVTVIVRTMDNDTVGEFLEFKCDPNVYAESVFPPGFIEKSTYWEVIYLYPSPKNDLISLFLYDQLGEKMIFEIQKHDAVQGVLIQRVYGKRVKCLIGSMGLFNSPQNKSIKSYQYNIEGIDLKKCPRRRACGYEFISGGTDFENLITIRACFTSSQYFLPPGDKEYFNLALIMKRVGTNNNVSVEQINKAIESLHPYRIGREQLIKWDIDETVEVDPRFCSAYRECFGLAKWRREHHLLISSEKRFIYVSFALLVISIIAWTFYEKFLAL